MDIRRPISKTRSRSRVTAEQGAGAGRGEGQGARVFGRTYVSHEYMHENTVNL